MPNLPGRNLNRSGAKQRQHAWVAKTPLGEKKSNDPYNSADFDKIGNRQREAYHTSALIRRIRRIQARNDAKLRREDSAPSAGSGSKEPEEQIRPHPGPDLSPNVPTTPKSDTINLRPIRSSKSAVPARVSRSQQPILRKMRSFILWQQVVPPDFMSQFNRQMRMWASWLLLAGCIIGLLIVSGVITYAWIASQLPPADELRLRSHQFATTQILDRDGNLLWEIIDPSGGRRTDVRLNQISRNVIWATLATEDRFFYVNIGVDPIAIIRALYDNLSEQRIVSGGSTITQQLARNVFLPPQERAEKSFSRKLREAVLAVEINRRYTKNQILEIYFNQIYYGNLAYGVEAAAQTYFGKTARELTVPEAAVLAGLPQSPALHDPYLNPAGAKARQRAVLGLMAKAGYITAAEAKAAGQAELHYRDPNFSLKAPHFVSLVRQELEQIIPADYIYHVGLRVHTTLDPNLQSAAEEEVRTQVEALAGREVSNGALVAIDVITGHILALVGSKDFQNKAIDGQVNMVTSLRQPGSVMKPLTYLAAFESLDWTPSALIMDAPTAYPDATGDVYRPTNVDHRYHGLVTVRSALANSYNVPAVKALEQVGVEALKDMAVRLGLTTLTGDDYGLSLTLGSGEVSLLEMAGAYQALANRGLLVKPTTIQNITDNFGMAIEPLPSQPHRALREEHAYLITHILADNEARRPGFGLHSPLHLSRPAAAKTGTTNDFRDNWTIGYTPDIVVAVWVGNADNTPMQNVGGATGAAPIWHNFMERAHQDLPIREFVRPPTVIDMEICADSGTIPSDVCPRRRTEIFFREQPPLGPEYDLHQLVEIDANTSLLASNYCRANVIKQYFRVYPPEGREWALRHRIAQPPVQYCPSYDIVAGLTKPVDGIRVRGTITIEGSAVAEDLAFYQLELGMGTNPTEFSLIQEPIRQLADHDVLGFFDTTQLENGPYTLRLVVFDQTGGYQDSRVRVLVDNPPETIVVRTPVTTPPSSATPTLTQTRTTILIGPVRVDSPEPRVIPTTTSADPGAVTTPTPLPLPATAAPENFSTNAYTTPLDIPPQSPPDTPAAFQPSEPASPPTATPGLTSSF